MKKFAKILTNKYLLATLCFVVWMCFFDQRDIFNTLDQKGKLDDLLAKKHYYQQEIATAQQELTDLQNNAAALEKFAREKYLMKKDGEDIYIIEDTINNKK
ncbi:FtsB family cell division protein [Parasediminibacterium sp. JCM 36343]|uniref:FtsB family cell division protein n=1 Tax=Parasediminibacterium sp. JCM 36343 TaxID=3374279 RepID=UPI00397E418D